MKIVVQSTIEMKLQSAQDVDTVYVVNVHVSKLEVIISPVNTADVIMQIVKCLKDHYVVVLSVVDADVVHVNVMPIGVVKIADVHLIALHVPIR